MIVNGINNFWGSHNPKKVVSRQCPYVRGEIKVHKNTQTTEPVYSMARAHTTESISSGHNRCSRNDFDFKVNPKKINKMFNIFMKLQWF